jgi:hypothetical protein
MIRNHIQYQGVLEAVCQKEDECVDLFSVLGVPTAIQAHRAHKFEYLLLTYQYHCPDEPLSATFTAYYAHDKRTYTRELERYRGANRSYPARESDDQLYGCAGQMMEGVKEIQALGWTKKGPTTSDWGSWFSELYEAWGPSFFDQVWLPPSLKATM